MSVRLGGYELEHRLGEGAQGRVWRARQSSALGRPVAVKRVAVRDATNVERIRQEAEALIALDHPHIVKVFEVIDDRDGIAIVMELAAGGSLAERLVRRGLLPLDEVVTIVTQIGDALRSAHRRGLLHLDVKPSNVLFTSDGHALLADFGSARWRPDDRSASGTDGYAAPEVVAGGDADGRADVYGLGRLAASAAGDAATDAFKHVVVRATAVSPEARYETVGDLVAALRDACADTSVVAPSEVTPATPVRAEPVTREFGPRPPRREAPVARRGVTRAQLVGSSCALLAVSAAAFLTLTNATPHAVDARSVADAHAGVTAPSPPCTPAATPTVPPDGELLYADVDGDRCPDPVVRIGNTLERNGVRFALGDLGDVPVLGDWNCDGVATPAVWRPAAAKAHLFEGWAAPGEALPATRIIDATAAPATECATA